MGRTSKGLKGPCGTGWQTCGSANGMSLFFLGSRGRYTTNERIQVKQRAPCRTEPKLEEGCLRVLVACMKPLKDSEWLQWTVSALLSSKTGLCKASAWHLKALIFTVFLFKSSYCSDLGAMGEKEQTTETPCWVQHGYFQTAPDIEPLCRCAPPHPPQKSQTSVWHPGELRLGHSGLGTAFTELCLLFVKGLWARTLSFRVLPLFFLVRSFTPFWREQAALWICLFSWAALLVPVPGLPHLGSWSPVMPTGLLILSLSGQAVTSAHGA